MTQNKYRTFMREKQIDSEIEELETKLVAQEESEEVELSDDQLSPEEKTFKKRYSDLRSHSQKEKNNWETEKNKLIERMSSLEAQLLEASKKKLEYPKTDEEIQEWVEKYPDVAGILKTIVMKEVQKDREEVDRQFASIAAEKRQIELNRAYEKLITAHPDFEEIKTTDEFQEWIREQPEAIIDSLYSDTKIDAKAAIRTVDLFKLDMTKKKKGKDDTRNDAARLVRTPSVETPDNGKPKFTQSMLRHMSQRDFEKYEKEIDEAMKHPEFYDVDGAAR